MDLSERRLKKYLNMTIQLPIQSIAEQRKKRGLFVTSTGKLINADANGALNIARLGLSVSKNEMKISDLVMRCVSQPKKLNILYSKSERLKQFSNK